MKPNETQTDARKTEMKRSTYQKIYDAEVMRARHAYSAAIRAGRSEAEASAEWDAIESAARANAHKKHSEDSHVVNDVRPDGFATSHHQNALCDD